MKHEQCKNCEKSKFSIKPRFLERLSLGLPTGTGVLIHCPDAVDGIIIPSEYDLICNIGCGSFKDNRLKKD
jgi:hypothetical protein